MIFNLSAGALLISCAPQEKPAEKAEAVNDAVHKAESLTAVKEKPEALGIDISHHQAVNIQNLLDENPSISFVFCKATEGETYIDPGFQSTWHALELSGIKRGAYHFYRTADNPVKQADFFLNTVGNNSENRIPLVLDFEQGGIADGSSVNEVQSQLLQFLHKLESASGQKPIIYTNVNVANTHLTDARFGVYPLWIADYSGADKPEIPHAWKEEGYTFWQKSDTYKLDGTTTDLDVYKSGLSINPE